MPDGPQYMIFTLGHFKIVEIFKVYIAYSIHPHFNIKSHVRLSKNRLDLHTDVASRQLISQSKLRFPIGFSYVELK